MYAQRRDALLKALDDRHAVAVLPTSAEYLRNGDSHFRFRPDSNFHYLTGFNEPEAVLVLSPRHPKHTYVLFVRERDPEKETWNGRRAGLEGAMKRYGAQLALPFHKLEEMLPEYLKDSTTIYYPLGHEPDIDRTVQSAISTARRFRKAGTSTPTNLADPNDLIADMRLFKEPAEIDLMVKAAEITAEAHRTAMAATRPGLNEREIQAIVEYVFCRRGGSGPAYSTIAGSGANGTILHYIENDAPLKEGELLLLDAGAERELYCADVTRTWPISGRFSAVQRQAYEIVLAAQKAAIDTCRPGSRFVDPHLAAVKVLTQGMVDLGLLSGSVDELIEKGAYQRYYMHKTSHWLGMDVHDVGDYHEGPAQRERPSRTLKPGMVLTIEPGLYVNEDDTTAPPALRGLGIRIEDDVLVTEVGPRVLTKACPKEVSDLEALVGSADPLALNS